MLSQKARFLDEQLNEILSNVRAAHGAHSPSSPLPSDRIHDVVGNIEEVVHSLASVSQQGYSPKSTARSQSDSVRLKSTQLLDELEDQLNRQLAVLESGGSPPGQPQEPKSEFKLAPNDFGPLLEQARGIQKDVGGLRADLVADLKHTPLEYLPEIMEDVLRQGIALQSQAEAAHEVVMERRQSEFMLYEQLVEQNTENMEEERELRKHLRDAALRCRNPSSKPWVAASSSEPSSDDVIVTHIKELEQTIETESNALKASEVNVAARYRLEENKLRQMINQEETVASDFEAAQKVLISEEEEAVAIRQANERDPKESKARDLQIQKFRKLENYVETCQDQVAQTTSELEAYLQARDEEESEKKQLELKKQLKAWDKERKKKLQKGGHKDLLKVISDAGDSTTMSSSTKMLENPASSQTLLKPKVEEDTNAQQDGEANAEVAEDGPVEATSAVEPSAEAVSSENQDPKPSPKSSFRSRMAAKKGDEVDKESVAETKTAEKPSVRSKLTAKAAPAEKPPAEKAATAPKASSRLKRAAK